MATLTSRKTARQQLAALLDEITDLVAVFDHEVKDFERQSPVAMVHSDGTRMDWPGYPVEYHRYWVTSFWRRDDAQDIEDRFDDLQMAIRQKLLDNYEEVGFWNGIDFDSEFSQPDYVIIDGVMYRWERIGVIVQVFCQE